jgi:predicted PurR-regulated permease PerM
MLKNILLTPPPFYIKLVSILLSLVIIVYGLHVLESLLIPLVFAILFSVLLFPLAIWLILRRLGADQ